jgi:DNA polymerase-3 subunit delta'
MRTFVETRGLTDADRRVALAAGSPGLAVSMDLDVYEERRRAMLALLQVAAGRASFGEWAKHAEAMAPRRQDKLDHLLGILYVLLEDILLLTEGAGEIRNIDIRSQLEDLARHVTFQWIRSAVRKTDQLAELVRRNIQKSIALDALVVALRRFAA